MSLAAKWLAVLHHIITKKNVIKKMQRLIKCSCYIRLLIVGWMKKSVTVSRNLGLRPAEQKCQCTLVYVCFFFNFIYILITYDATGKYKKGIMRDFPVLCIRAAAGMTVI